MKHATVLFRAAITGSLLAFFATAAHAHPGHGAEVGGIGWGLMHPFTGLDHLLAMVAVGLWAVQLGRRSMWVLPLAFLMSMGAGAAAGLKGFQMPMVESAILASIFVLGALVAYTVRLPLAVSGAIVAVGAFFHGLAHGTEMPADGALSTALGFLFSTALLHGVGIVVGMTLLNSPRAYAIRVAGVAVFVAGVLIGFGIL